MIFLFEEGCNCNYNCVKAMSFFFCFNDGTHKGGIIFNYFPSKMLEVILSHPNKNIRHIQITLVFD